LPELVERDKTIRYSKLPTTVAEKTALKPPKNKDLPVALQSEAFDITEYFNHFKIIFI
jgi:hypothetical protein